MTGIQIFNKANMSRLPTGEPVLSVNGKSGALTFSKSLLAATGMKSGSAVVFGLKNTPPPCHY